MSSKFRFGVLGGTFDPVHLGHLVAAESVRDALALDKVLFVPAGVPPHKEAVNVSAARHRYLMTVLATLSNPQFEVHRVDLDRQGKSFTVDTLAALQEELGEEVELCFILGADSLADIPNWHEPERLLGGFRFVVTTRPGWDLSSAKESLGHLYSAHHERIETLEIPAVEVSSREIRERAVAGRSLRYLVPDLVLRYIHAHDLYGPPVADPCEL